MLKIFEVSLLQVIHLDFNFVGNVLNHCLEETKDLSFKEANAQGKRSWGYLFSLRVV